MTMPKGWTPKKIRKDARNYSLAAEARKCMQEQETEARKWEEQQRQKQQQELDPRSVDYYYTVVKPQISKPGITPEEYSKILAEYGEAKVRESPSFPREYEGKYIGLVGNVFS